MKIVTVVGARPQFIKAAAGSRAIRKKHQEILVHTGQHFDDNMSAVFFREMDIPEPDHHLGISGGSHAEMTARMLVELEKVFLLEKPDAVLVYGDTNSTLDFCATEDALAKLKKEGLGDRSYCVGNIMYDSFLHFAGNAWDHPNILDFDGKQVAVPEEFYYMTCHRQENAGSDEPLTEILSAMNSLPAPTIYPVHPRNRERAMRLVAEKKLDKILLTQPVGYPDSVQLTKHAKKIVTDSGGLQCEAFYAGVQCVFVLDYVVWPETMVGNRNQLAKADREDILEKLSAEQVIDPAYQPFGDGHAAEKICEIISGTDFHGKNKDMK